MFGARAVIGSARCMSGMLLGPRSIFGEEQLTNFGR